MWKRIRWESDKNSGFGISWCIYKHKKLIERITTRKSRLRLRGILIIPSLSIKKL